MRININSVLITWMLSGFYVVGWCIYIVEWKSLLGMLELMATMAAGLFLLVFWLYSMLLIRSFKKWRRRLNEDKGITDRMKKSWKKVKTKNNPGGGFELGDKK